MEALAAFRLTPQPDCVKPSYNKSLKKMDPKSSNAASGPVLYPLVVPKLSLKKGEFSSAMSIHKKNPHIIYREIQRFASQNNLRKAFILLDYLERNAVPVNVTTFVSLISACIRLKSVDAAKQVHSHIAKNGLSKNEFLCTRLVHLYACCGSVEDAKGVFESMPAKSVYPWNALLRGKVMMGRYDQSEISSSFLEMQSSSVESDAYSFSCLIKSLAGNRSLRQGSKIHGILIKNGFYSSPMLKTGLMDMYFKCGKVKPARSIFEEVEAEKKDVVIWGAMVAGFAHNKLQREALRYTKLMIDDGIEVNSVILTTILPVAGEILARKTGQELHAYLIKRRGYSKEPFVNSALIDMYCKSGDMASARKAFFACSARNAVSWTALLSGYASSGSFEQALRSIIWMQRDGFRPDTVTVATAIPVCSELRALNPGREIHAYALRNGCLPSVSISTSLMVMYSRCGKWDCSSRLFGKMERKNVIAWTAMIECSIERGFLYDALDVFRAMMRPSGCRPDSVALSRALHVCGELRSVELGKEIHGRVLRRGGSEDESPELVRMYGACGRIEDAKRVFESIAVKGSMSWTAAIEAYGHAKRPDEALLAFDRMLSSGVLPTRFTIAAVLKVCEDGGLGDEAVKLLAGEYGMTTAAAASDEHYSCVVRLLSRLGRTEEADRFERLRNLSSPAF
ncbi:hypothetical protein M569_00856 [Genlisea aurea]|uniref:Pentacotripeptide-repeat region of PRORP domain-containing protein n=1 Tax=Genlisea aurea TaxID=192259 RepID=S8D3G4_9LAMI|nr:hypothetical protein M569_00856 [Genlisea aurea]